MSVGAGLMHQPSGEPERRLLQAIGRSAPAPQGIAVLNADGQVLDWVLMFDNDQSVLEFLDHTMKQFKEHPDGSQPFLTQRYVRFSSQRREGVPAHSVNLSGLAMHTKPERCPADLAYPPGTMMAKVFGRRTDKDGRALAAAVNQEDYAQDKFAIEPGLQEQLWQAIGKAGNESAKVPEGLARLWAAYTYLGMLDVRPLNNPAGAKSSRSEYQFDVRADAGWPGWFRVTGTSHTAAGQQRRIGDGAGFEQEVELNWTGWLRLNKGRLASLVLSATGRERLKWDNHLPAANNGYEVANLPGGRAVDWEGPVRFGILGEPATP